MIRPRGPRARWIVDVASAILVMSVLACGKVQGNASPDAASPDAPAPDGAGPTSGAVLVQQATAASTTAATLSATLEAPTAAGHLLVMIGVSADGPLATVTGGGVAAWAAATLSFTNANIEIWYGVVTTPSNAPVTITRATANDLRLNVTEWSGLVAAQRNVLDNATSQAGTTTVASAPPLDTQATELLVFGAANFEPDMGFEAPSDGPWSAMTAVIVPDLLGQVSWYQVRPATAAFQPTVLSYGTTWDAGIAAFKIAP